MVVTQQPLLSDREHSVRSSVFISSNEDWLHSISLLSQARHSISKYSFHQDSHSACNGRWGQIQCKAFFLTFRFNPRQNPGNNNKGNKAHNAETQKRLTTVGISGKQMALVIWFSAPEPKAFILEHLLEFCSCLRTHTKNNEKKIYPDNVFIWILQDHYSRCFTPVNNSTSQSRLAQPKFPDRMCKVFIVTFQLLLQ